MLAWKIRDPSREKLLSCGESPDGIRAVMRPLRVSIEVDHAGGRRGHEQPPAVLGERHVVGAIAVDLGPPADLAGLQADRDDVGEARTGEVDGAAVGRGEAVVDVLVMALADQRADAVVVELRRRVGRDLGDPLVAVGNDVEALEPLEAARVDQVRGAGPVVADDEHVAVGPLTRSLCGRDEAGEQDDGGGEQEGAHGPMPARRRRAHRRGQATVRAFRRSGARPPPTAPRRPRRRQRLQERRSTWRRP